MTALHEGGSRVVAIGGGHGLARSLGAARRYASTITAIVSVADDGGSSGRLREALGIAAPGDVRRCLSALLPTPTIFGRSIEHRFDSGELEGHAFGNLFIAALVATTGDFVSGIDEACRVLGTVGQVLPATSCPVVLKAEAHGIDVEGQVRIMGSDDISNLSIVPPDAKTPERAIDAILGADHILIGPGSLYTSVLAACVPEAIVAALDRTTAQKIYIGNLREQIPETAHYDVGRHVAALIGHGITPDVVLCDPTNIEIGEISENIFVVSTSLAGPNRLVHDEERLAAALVNVAGR